MVSRSYILSVVENKRLNDREYAKNNIKAAMRLQALSQNIPLLRQLINSKHIVSIPELLRCHTIIMVNFS